MVVLKLKQEIKTFVQAVKAQNKQIGFVATMGALHNGHLSLLATAAAQNDCVICSIFVNPLQFNDKKDFEKYPQTTDADLKLLESKACDVVFLPSVDEMYSSEDTTQFDFGNLDKVMEGVFRPGHFLGMAKVVKRLFDYIMPDKAYFGEKDFQQLAIIRKFTSDLNLPVKIIGCPILREDDGLAMSSRNTLLEASQRASASMIYKTLIWAKTEVTTSTPTKLKSEVEQKINEVPDFQLEYFELATATNLQLINEWKNSSPVMAFIVVRVGAVRLIDNLVLLP